MPRCLSASTAPMKCAVATMAGLQSATGYVRKQLGHRIRLRRTPVIVFEEDRSLERGSRVLTLAESTQSRPPKLRDAEGN